MESIVASGDRLHFFEYLEIDILQEYLRTGIHYFLQVLLGSHPSLVSWRYYAQEITALVDFVKDFYFLKRHKGTYAEHFYDVQRRTSRTMGKLWALANAFLWTIVPYLLAKLDALYNQTIAAQLDGKKLVTWQKVLLKTYPFLYAIIGVLQTIQKFRYLLQPDRKYYSLYYLVSKDDLGHSPVQIGQSKYPIMELLKKPGLLALLISHKILTLYFSRRNQGEKSKHRGSSERIVPPPVPITRIQGSNKCPLCTRQIKQATAVRASGYVYCYDCIHDSMQKNGRCPMSQLEIDESSLQLIYE